MTEQDGTAGLVLHGRDDTRYALRELNPFVVLGADYAKTAGKDVLTGSKKDDRLYGQSANDVLVGGARWTNRRVASADFFASNRTKWRTAA